MTTNHYDHAGNLTDTFGPGRSGEFDDEGRSLTAPHSSTAYDEGIDGLQTTWWDKADFLGAPATRTTTGLSNDWGSGAPGDLSVTDNFSGRLTGDLVLPEAGAYGLSAEVGSDDGVRVVVDDRVVIDRWDTYRDTVLRDAPTAYWRVGETSGTTAADETGNHPATYRNGVTLGHPGALSEDANTAGGFDGSDDKLDGPTRTRPTNNFAFEAWVRPTATHQIDSQSSSGTAGTSGQRYAFAPDYLNTEAGAGLSVGTNGISVYEHAYDYMPAVAVYQGKISGWAHVVVNYVNKQPRIYLNGKLVKYGNTSPKTVRGPLDASYYSYGAFQGDLDEVAFYPASLTTDQIQAHFKAGRAKLSGTTEFDPYRDYIVDDRPLAYWRLSETSGTVAKDSSGNSNDGTYQNGVKLEVPGSLPSDPAEHAARFDGSNDLVSSSTSRPYNSFTLEAWVKPTATHQIDTQSTSGTAGASGQRYLFVPDISSGSQAGVGVSVGNNGVSVYEHGSDYMPALAVWSGRLEGWNHLIVTYKDKKPRMYINGVKVRIGLQSSRSQTNAPRSVGYHSYGAYKGDIDEVTIYDHPLPEGDIYAHFQQGRSRFPEPVRTLDSGPKRIRVDYQERQGDAKLALTWTTPSNVTEAIPAASLKPRYGLATSSADPDGRKTATEYAVPELGLPTASVVDPGGLNLTSTTTYEQKEEGKFFRRISRTLPKGLETTVTYSYFASGETADNPCTGATEAIDQGGAMKSTAAADPDGSGAQTPIVREYRHDLAGRVVAQRVVGDSAWGCTTYDLRGRTTSVKDSSGKVTSFDYSDPADTTVTYTDSAGTRTTSAKVDYLGRGIAYTDEHGTTTRTFYDRAGKVTHTTRQFQEGAEKLLESYRYDHSGRVAAMSEHTSWTPPTVVTPESITGMKLWLRSDTVTPGSGNEVHSWPDSSPLGNHASRGTAGSAMPSYVPSSQAGFPAVSFDGIQDSLEVAGEAHFDLSSYTVIFVGRFDQAGGKLLGKGLREGGKPQPLDAYHKLEVGAASLTSGEATDKVEAEPITKATIVGAVVVASETDIRLYRNGEEFQTTTSGAPELTIFNDAPLALGGPYYDGGGSEVEGSFQGEVQEVIVYDHALSDAELEGLTRQLGERYSIFTHGDPGRGASPSETTRRAASPPPPVRGAYPPPPGTTPTGGGWRRWPPLWELPRSTRTSTSAPLPATSPRTRVPPVPATTPTTGPVGL